MRKLISIQTAPSIANRTAARTLTRIMRAPCDLMIAAASVLLTWNRRSIERRQLREMPNHLLADMGISRAEADREGGKPFWLV